MAGGENPPRPWCKIQDLLAGTRPPWVRVESACTAVNKEEGGAAGGRNLGGKPVRWPRSESSENCGFWGILGLTAGGFFGKIFLLKV